MAQIIFSGEESARFSRLGLALVAAGLKISVEVNGQEPLTKRGLQLEGLVTGGKLDGYLRYLEIREEGSDVVYWVAGSNATRSIACKEIKFDFPGDSLEMIREYALTNQTFLPGIGMSGTAFDAMLIEIDRVMAEKSPENVSFLLNALSNENEDVVLEAALSLRAFASVIIATRTIQSDAETTMLAALNRVQNKDTRIGLAEDLGYVGTDASMGPLASLLRDANEHDHVRWASAIALGRLSAKAVSEEAVVESLIQGLDSPHEWTVAAILLSLARRVGLTNRSRLENIFLGYLSDSKAPRLRLYACLGLSECSPISRQSLEPLGDVLADPKTPGDVRGYAALAISSSLTECDDDFRSKLQLRLKTAIPVRNLALKEPEDIWGLEFIAELTTLLEMNEFSAAVHEGLSESFKDWRAAYYKSMALYEMAEASARRGEGDRGNELLDEALSTLPPSETLPSDAVDAIAFRKDIVKARRKLNQLVYSWAEDILSGTDFDYLEKEFREVSGSYARYSTPPKSSNTKRLSDRELEYLRNTKKLIEVIGLLVALDGHVRSDEIDVNLLRNRISVIVDYLEPLKARFSHSFASSLNELVETSLANLNSADATLAHATMPLADKLRHLRAMIAELRSLVRQATWPMPARVCPVFGLGKGTISVVQEDLKGAGTDKSPYLYPGGMPVILKLQGQIQELVPGGRTTVHLICSTAGNELRQKLHQVEGTYQCSFDISPWVTSALSVTSTVSLKFETRDCSQVIAEVSVHLKRES